MNNLLQLINRYGQLNLNLGYLYALKGHTEPFPMIMNEGMLREELEKLAKEINLNCTKKAT